MRYHNRNAVFGLPAGAQAPARGFLCRPDGAGDVGDAVKFKNVYFINGTAYAGKSTMVKLLAEACGGIACQENYHDALLGQLSRDEFPCLTYSQDLKDWREFVWRSPEGV